MNKKFFYLSLIPFLLTGCKSGKNSNSSLPINEDCIVKENVTIDFWCMADQTYLDELERMINDFKQVEPHVKVILTNPQGAGNYSVLERNVVSGFFKGLYPDLVQCYPDNAYKYLSRGYAVNVEYFLKDATMGVISSDGKTDYIQAFLDEGKTYPVEGTYSLPFCKSTELMYYNADALIGLDLHTINANINGGKPLDESYLDNLTWEELFGNLCPAIKTYNQALPAEQKLYVEGDDSAIFTYDSDENLFITLAKQYGYGYTSVDANGEGKIDFNTPNMKGLIKNFYSYNKNGYLQTKNSYKNYVSYLFQDRKSLFTVSSTAGLAYNYNKKEPFKIGVARIPYAQGREYMCINQGPSICILNHFDDNRAMASYLFWKFITNEENALSWSMLTGYMPIRNSSYENEQYVEASKITTSDDLYLLAQAANYRKIADVKESTYNTDVFKGSSNARTNVGLLLKDCFNSENIDNDIDQIFDLYYYDTESHLEQKDEESV